MTIDAVRHPAEALADELMASLDPEQRAAALLPDGPAQVIAPAGSGKTTTLVARLGVLLARGVAPDRICVVTFNREAALELTARIARRLAPRVAGAEAIEVRTLHAMARQVLLDAGQPVRLLRDRMPLLRAARRQVLARAAHTAAQDALEPPEAAALDTAVSAWKIEGRLPVGPGGEVLRAYEGLLRTRGEIDFDDLVVGAVEALATDGSLRDRWQQRFTHLCVDEFQDVDAAQLRFVQALAEPQRNLFVVGDDDQTIYAWRLADVRRILGFGAAYPGARRIQLATNYRCPAAVIAASRQLIEVNRERFAKRIEPPPGAQPVEGALVAVSTADESWPDRLAALAAQESAADRTICFLSRTRSELTPVLISLVRAGIPHRTSVPAALELEPVRQLLADVARLPEEAPAFRAMLHVRAARGWRRSDASDTVGDDEHAAIDALLGWAAGYRTLGAFLEGERVARTRINRLRRDEAAVELITVHGAKGREWQTVVVLHVEDGHIPNRRSLVDGDDPARAMEEERRLAYVAFTRATRRLVLAYDPVRPSPFLGEMGLLPRGQPPAQPR